MLAYLRIPTTRAVRGLGVSREVRARFRVFGLELVFKKGWSHGGQLRGDGKRLHAKLEAIWVRSRSMGGFHMGRVKTSHVTGGETMGSWNSKRRALIGYGVQLLLGGSCASEGTATRQKACGRRRARGRCWAAQSAARRPRSGCPVLEGFGWAV